MRYVIATALLALAGCNPEPRLKAADFEPTCARECLANESDCLQGGRGQWSGKNLIRQCNRNRNECLSTCPPRK